MRKARIVILNQLNTKKIDKYNFEKNCKLKIMRGNNVSIHDVVKKKTTKLILNQLNIKKIKSTKTILKKFIKKSKRKK
jgi:hypothetical protein